MHHKKEIVSRLLNPLIYILKILHLSDWCSNAQKLQLKFNYWTLKSDFLRVFLDHKRVLWINVCSIRKFRSLKNFRKKLRTQKNPELLRRFANIIFPIRLDMQFEKKLNGVDEFILLRNQLIYMQYKRLCMHIKLTWWRCLRF